MHMLVVFLLMNHQCMVTNHLKFGLILVVLGGNVSNYCNLHRKKMQLNFSKPNKSASIWLASVFKVNPLIVISLLKCVRNQPSLQSVTWILEAVSWPEEWKYSGTYSDSCKALHNSARRPGLPGGSTELCLQLSAEDEHKNTLWPLRHWHNGSDRHQPPWRHFFPRLS